MFRGIRLAIAIREEAESAFEEQCRLVGVHVDLAAAESAHCGTLHRLSRVIAAAPGNRT